MSTTTPADATNPQHYKRLDPEPIDVIEKWGLGFHLGNAVKYIARAGHKFGASAALDLAKAVWYVNRARGDQPAEQPLPTDVVELRREVMRWKISAERLAVRIRDSATDNLDDRKAAGRVLIGLPLVADVPDDNKHEPLEPSAF